MTGVQTCALPIYHWLNTIVGILDQAFHLTEEEQFHVLDMVLRLLITLDIPDRSDPLVIPAPLALEISAAVYTTLLDSQRRAGVQHPARLSTRHDIVVSIEAWCESLTSLLTVAYPDISPEERLITHGIFAAILDALGVPDRAATFFPDEVVRAARTIDA